MEPFVFLSSMFAPPAAAPAFDASSIHATLDTIGAALLLVSLYFVKQIIGDFRQLHRDVWGPKGINERLVVAETKIEDLASSPAPVEIPHGTHGYSPPLERDVARGPR